MKKFKLTKTQTVIGVLAVAAAGALTAASAATLSVQATSTLQAGTTDIVGCQTATLLVDAATPVWNNGAFEVSAINLSAIDAACAGNQVKLEVLDAAGASIGSAAAATISGTTLSVNLGSAVDAEDVEAFAVVIF